jgi:putative photosynthetic complex assembly protein 2
MIDWLHIPWVAAVVALIVWWFSTGLILLGVKRADHGLGVSHLVLTLLSLPFLALGCWGFWATLEGTSVWSIYGAFGSAILIWGWFELAFLCGIISGPNTYNCPEGIPAWERFLRAWGTVAYSEVALIVIMIALAWIGQGAENMFGVWTFAVLFFARISAKLNVYLGVPNINVDFLPKPMEHLASHFRIAPMNALFPVSVTVLTFATGCWLERWGAQAIGAPDAVGFALLTALTALALLEHWMMVIPLADAKLWQWLLPQKPTASKTIKFL